MSEIPPNQQNKAFADGSYRLEVAIPPYSGRDSILTICFQDKHSLPWRGVNWWGSPS